MFKSNFIFLEEEFPLLNNLAQAAEYNLHQDPGTSLYKLRQYGEYMTEQIFDTYGMDLPENNTFQNRVFILRNQSVLPANVVDHFTILRHKGNTAIHQFKGTIEEAKSSLFAAFKLGKWFYESYSVKNNPISDVKFKMPADLDARHALHTLENELAAVRIQFEQLLQQTKSVSTAQQENFTARAKQSASNLEMSEAQTRILIDEHLTKAGWEVDSININYKTHKTLPAKGTNLAIAEWPCGKLWADYALFIGEELYAIVEAKKYAQDISSNLDQSKLYATTILESENHQLIGQWNNYKVPFLFATNGRAFIE